MNDDWMVALEARGCARLFVLTDPSSGLRAFVAIDDLRLGPAAGGVRTLRYASVRDAVDDACALARAMTLKCALAGLDAGGGKCVVMDHEGLDRARAFERLGALIDDLGGVFRTAGDLGTAGADLRAMARTTRYVHTDETGLADATARGLVACVRACVAMKGEGDALSGLRVAVQGAGSIGAAVARALAREGVEVTIADLDSALAQSVAEPIGARVIGPDALLLSDVDVVAPCARGGVITREVASRLRAFAVCGAANNALADRGAAEMLAAQTIWHVPDPIASAGAVIDGIGKSVMRLASRTPLIDRLGQTAREVLEEAKATGALPIDVAEQIARARIAAVAEARARARGVDQGSRV